MFPKLMIFQVNWPYNQFYLDWTHFSWVLSLSKIVNGVCICHPPSSLHSICWIWRMCTCLRWIRKKRRPAHTLIEHLVYCQYGLLLRYSAIQIDFYIQIQTNLRNVRNMFLNQLFVIPHRNAFTSIKSYSYGLAFRLIVISIYIFTFFASVYFDSTILSDQKNIILKIGM